jgi:hypothetical protein
MVPSKLLTLAVALLAQGVFAFRPAADVVSRTKLSHSSRISGSMEASRRSFVEHVAGASIAVLGTGVLIPERAIASGGATAGGVYLLSAKQRYNDRVKAGVKGFLSIGAPLEAGEVGVVRTFFTDEEKGSWKDLSAAGYLLANAFRRTSSAAPDTLPSVKVRPLCWFAWCVGTRSRSNGLSLFTFIFRRNGRHSQVKSRP